MENFIGKLKTPKLTRGKNKLGHADQHSNPSIDSEPVHDELGVPRELASAIAKKDLLVLLEIVHGALNKVLKDAIKNDQPNESWTVLIKKLNLHLATIENHSAKLREDGDAATLALIPTATTPLENLGTYASELENVYQRLLDNKPDAASPDAVDNAFRTYTNALHRFVASTVEEIWQSTSQFQSETQDEEAISRQLEVSRKLEAAKVHGDRHQKCTSGTRQNTLKAIRLWAEDESPSKQVFCLLDAAGSGKSTVAKHMAEEWKRDHQMLVAHYFFSRDTVQTASVNLFCSTVSDDFAHCDTQFKAEKEKWEAEHQNWKILPFDEQFDGLVAGPLRVLNRRAILLVDALDECDEKGGSRAKLLATLCDPQRSTSLLRIFATGRPHDDITDWAKGAKVSCSDFKELEGDNKDVEEYVQSRFAGLPDVEDRVSRAIHHANGVFIRARVVCDLLVRIHHGDKLPEGVQVTLSDLYKLALEQSMPQDEALRGAMETVLQMILAAREPLSIAELERLSPWRGRGVVEQISTRLGSLLLFQDHEDPIRFLHPTFREFLIGRPTAANSFTRSKLGHYTLASGCLNALQRGEGLDSGKISTRKVASFHSTFVDSTFRIFHYASNSWAHHCLLSYRKLGLNKQILESIDALRNWMSPEADKLQAALSLSQQNMSPEITETMVSQALQIIVRTLVPQLIDSRVNSALRAYICRM